VRRSVLVLTDVDGGETQLTVTGLDRLAYDRLLADHPPRHDRAELWNEETFSPALISACTGRSDLWAEQFWVEAAVDEAETVMQECVALSAPGSWDWAKRRLLRDLRLRTELRLCLKAGIPHSHFLGGPLGWTDDDQDLALASFELDADRCPGPCGMPTSAMQDPDAGAVEQVSCVHCEQLALARKQVPDEERDRIHVYITPVVPGEREG
jgi:hypothetical protein